MSRRKNKSNKKRFIKPDALYNNIFLAKFVNIIMNDGKKTVATRILYSALDIVKKDTDLPIEEIVDKIINLLAPTVELRSCRIGGSNYQVPIKVATERSHAIAMKWLKEAALNRKSKAMYLRLADEIKDLFASKGEAYKKHENNNKMAEANKAFAHYRWSN